MSASPVARQATQSQVIPSRKVLLSDPAQLPADYASTPGGTLYSTTPGGTRIVYERAFLLQLRHSPLARTPPKNIPSALIRGASHDDSAKENIDYWWKRMRTRTSSSWRCRPRAGRISTSLGQAVDGDATCHCLKSLRLLCFYSHCPLASF
ncbi:Uncharacterized protein GBIM_01826 [Gryllus bimaculatus]|nr:Uncharacterized protein GBIM_01826 [Gryllus bimaculatus]